jgi:hypothetical protein
MGHPDRKRGALPIEITGTRPVTTLLESALRAQGVDQVSEEVSANIRG